MGIYRVLATAGKLVGYDRLHKTAYDIRSRNNVTTLLEVTESIFYRAILFAVLVCYNKLQIHTLSAPCSHSVHPAVAYLCLAIQRIAYIDTSPTGIYLC